jgi:creatinine amidohydrolase
LNAGTMLDHRNSSAEIDAAAPAVAVLGIGAIEQHSGHLPLATDWYSVAEMSRRLAEALGALLIMPWPFSMSECHGPAAGTVWLRPETLAAVVRDLVLSLRDQGIRQIVIVNGHGGNFVLESVIRELNLAYDDLVVLLYPFEGGLGFAHLYEHGDVDSHAGEVETSVMLALRPDLVRAERDDCVPCLGRGYLDYMYMDRISPAGVTGIASAGTAEKGRRGLDAEAAAAAVGVRQMLATVAELKAMPTVPEKD